MFLRYKFKEVEKCTHNETASFVNLGGTREGIVFPIAVH